MPHAVDLQPGCLLEGRYRVLEPLGSGGYGVVFKAEQLSTGQPVAIKLLHHHRADGQSGAAARLQREMRLVGRLRHPNIVRLIDNGSYGELPYTVLEYVEGRNLQDVLAEEGALTPRETKRLMAQVLDALCCAHTLGIVHRDLKPANIMVTSPSGRRNAMVLDFGIAGVVRDHRAHDYESLTRDGAFPGTPGYMAPEQLRSPQTVVAQTDLYAWGLVFLECLTGHPVLGGGSLPAIIYAQLSQSPVPVPDALAAHPLGRILAKAVAKPLDERYLSGQTLLEDLEACDVELELVLDEAVGCSPLGPTASGTSLDELAERSVAEALATTMTGGLADIPVGGAQKPESFHAPSVGVETSGEDLDDHQVETLAPDRDSTPAVARRDGAEAGPAWPIRPRMSARWVRWAGIGLLAALAAGAVLVGRVSTDEVASRAAEPRAARPPVADLGEGPTDRAGDGGSGEAARGTSRRPESGPPPAATSAPLGVDLVTVPPAKCVLGLSPADKEALFSAYPPDAYDYVPFDLDLTDLAKQTWDRPALEVMRFEATWADWRAHLAAAPHLQEACDSALPVPGADHLPVTMVGAAEARAFCEGLGMRLPTAREWEALARGESGRWFGFSPSSPNPSQRAQLHTRPEESEMAWNQVDGMHHLSGGVREWVSCEPGQSYCGDGYGHRGGSWRDTEFWMLAFMPGLLQLGVSPACQRSEDIGFRCVRPAPAE